MTVLFCVSHDLADPEIEYQWTQISRVMTDGRHRIPWVELAYIILHLVVGQQATLDANNLKLPGRMSKIWSPCHSIWLLHPYHCQLPFFWRRPAFRTCVTLSNRSLLCNITLFCFTIELGTFFKSECSKEGSCFCYKGLSLRRRPPRLISVNWDAWIAHDLLTLLWHSSWAILVVVIGERVVFRCQF